MKTNFEIACELCFAFMADLGIKQSDFLNFCYENKIDSKKVTEYVNKNYEKF